MRPYQQSRYREKNRRCRGIQHQLGEPFQERRQAAAPCARCQCGKCVYFLLDDLSTEVGPAVIPASTARPDLFDEDLDPQDNDAAPVLDTGINGAEAWARTAWEQRAVLAAVLYGQHRFVHRWMCLADTIKIAVVLLYSAVMLGLMEWPPVGSWPGWLFFVPLLVGSVLLHLVKLVHRNRRVSRAMRRYGVDEDLLQASRHMIRL
jgi:hypothetical protein